MLKVFLKFPFEDTSGRRLDTVWY